MKVGRFNYKIDTKIDFTAAGAVRGLSVLNTGAGPNLIHEATIAELQIARRSPTKESLVLLDEHERTLNLKAINMLTVISW